MAKTLSAKVKGSKELLKELHARDVSVKKSVRAACKAGATVIRDDAEARAPTSHGGKVVLVRASFPKREVCEAVVKASTKRWYLKFMETGATSHEITGAPLVFEGDNGLIVIGGVNHPGMAARPWLRPAFDTNKDAAVEVVGDVLYEAVVAARATVAGADDEG